MPLSFRAITVAAACSLAFLSSAESRANINLEFRPANQTVIVGDFFSISLFAVSDSSSSQSIASIDAILSWTPASVALTGLVNNGPYSWLSFGFPNDSGLDGINAPYGAVPGNDGNAYFRSFRNFSSPAVATPSGLLIAKFNFQALAQTPSTQLSMPASMGSFTRTIVVDGFTAGMEVTGNLGSANVTIIPEPGTACMLVPACLTVARRRRSRAG